MRLIGFESNGERHIGRVEDGRVHDLGEIGAFYASGGQVADTGQVFDRAELTEAPCVPVTSRVFCVGVNYLDHAAESKSMVNMDLPEHPVVFGRWAQSLNVHDAVVPLPPNEPGLDFEAELAVIIKDEVWLADQDTALDHVLGYSAFNDLSARTKQRHTPQFTLGKNPDESGPLGPELVTADELPRGAEGLRIMTRVNGEVMQDANTSLLIHSIPKIIEYITDTVTLLPGDVIASGTPGGVGAARPPPVFCGEGDVVEVEIEQIGVLRNTFRAR
ncbi:MAG: fumarylacetoacetate hydrolase family protein [Propionibacterium sp.]|nr:fumarylacetoacetate hydrolase family protein [Propionibacterium sp.]